MYVCMYVCLKQKQSHLIRNLVNHVVTNGVPRVFDAQGEQSQWPPHTDIRNFKKSQLFIEFPFYLSQ